VVQLQGSGAACVAAEWIGGVAVTGFVKSRSMYRELLGDVRQEFLSASWLVSGIVWPAG